MKKGLTIGLIIFFLLIVVFFIWAFGFSSKDSLDDDKVEQSESKKEPALTGEQDKKSEQEEVEENKETDDKDQKDKDTNKKDKKQITKQLEEDSTYIVKALTKTQDDLNKSSTQANIKDAATKEFREKYFDEGKKGNDKIDIEIKNPKFKVDDDKDLDKDKSEIKGTLTYDQLQKPKDKSDKNIKPSTNIDTKAQFWFKKEDDKYKVSKFKR